MQTDLTHSTWHVVKTDMGVDALLSANSVFTVCNGYLSLKGNLLEDRDGEYPSTFVAGVFDRADYFAFVRPVSYERRQFDPRYFDDAGMSPSIANLPNPLFLRVFVGDRELSFREDTVSGFTQVYDLRRGVYGYEYVIASAEGRHTRLRMERFCHMERPHRAYMRYAVTPLDYSDTLRVQCGIDGTVRSNLKLDKQFEVLDAACPDENTEFLTVRTYLKRQEVRIAARSLLRAETSQSLIEHQVVSHWYTRDVAPDKPLSVDRMIVITSDEDARHGTHCDLHAELVAAASSGYDTALAEHAAWWEDRWRRIDVRIEGDELAQRYLRFCTMHVMAAAPRHSDRLSVPCKLLTGEWYQGTVFYDTDLYIEPFFLLTDPGIAKSCLNYRYVGLVPGREIAKRFGWQGAKLAWQAGPYGEEELGYWWRFTLANIHINADVAYSLMQYWRVTEDTEFLYCQGAKILVEFARFYVSRARHDREDDSYHFDGVAGPDEGHCESTDNFYTNILARETLRFAAWVVETLKKSNPSRYDDLAARLDMRAEEPGRWKDVADKLRVLYDSNTHLIEQYDGYYALKPVSEGFLDNRKEWWTPVFPYQAIHQPDVIMALVLLRDQYPLEVIRANYEYYKPRTMNFSSMSFVINSIAATLIGDADTAYEQFMISAGEDLDESLTGRHDVKDGIHGTASAGAWLAAVSGFGGVFIGKDGLSIDPHLPAHWKSLRFRIAYRGAALFLHVTQDNLEITVADKSVSIRILGRKQDLEAGETHNFPLL